ncbi:MAG: hypothetical protein JW863_21600 [Chitinispirillaceae bacterium]|nr:hypothetical protein [Chitinispirillaceae bacterium]
MNRTWISLSILSLLVGGSMLVCDRNIAGSATETGNVVGRVVSQESGSAVPGAKISFFQKRASVASPDETVIPEKELFSDDEGEFSLELTEGNYTLFASDGSEYSFIDNVVPVADETVDLEVVLKNPGGICGYIDNSLELRGTGSVVVHLIGTAIYNNVATDGAFSIDNIPAGTYTLASYSTFQEEFSPDYRQVTVYPDSVTDLGHYSLIYNGIPIPRNVTAGYDTVNEVVRLSWDPITPYDDFQEYEVLRGERGLAEHKLAQIAYTEDTFYIDSISFVSDEKMEYEYCVRVNNKLGEKGAYYGIYPVEVISFASTLPQIDAGADQSVDLNTIVELEGMVAASLRPVVKMEWKIGSADWEECDSGKVVFTTDSLLEPESITCYFRVTDSTGNYSVDSLVVVKKVQVTLYGRCPAMLNGGSSYTYFKGKYWIVGLITQYGQYAVWSSADLVTWNLANATPGIAYGGTLVGLQDTLFLVNLYYTNSAYSSVDGIEWKELPADSVETAPKLYAFSFHGKITSIESRYISATSSSELYLLTSGDCIAWQSRRMSLPLTSWFNIYHFGSFGDDLIIIGTENSFYRKFISSDDGETWSEVALWDEDFPTFRDNIYFFRSSDSSAIALYQEVTGDRSEGWAILRNGVWMTAEKQSIPLPFTPVSTLWGDTRKWYQMFGKRLVFIGEDGFFRSITFK